jgi:hypothetical protein
MLVQFAITGMIGAASNPVAGAQDAHLAAAHHHGHETLADHRRALAGDGGPGVGAKLLLVLFGQIVLGVNYLREPLGVLLVAVAFSLWIASMGLFIGMLAQGEEQVILFCLIAMFLFTSLGGAWFPLEVTGKAFYTIGHLTPGAWAMDGLQNILVRGLGLASVWQPPASCWPTPWAFLSWPCGAFGQGGITNGSETKNLARETRQQARLSQSDRPASRLSLLQCRPQDGGRGRRSGGVGQPQ